MSWKTYGYSNGSNDTPEPEVQYNTDGNFSHHYYNTSVGNSSIYDTLNHISWFHTCILFVDSSETYYYRIPASGECVNQSETYSFTAQPAMGDSKSINITIVGDIGYDTDRNKNSTSKTIRALIDVANSTNFFLHVGDISYADESSVPLAIVNNYEPRWNDFQQSMQAITAKKFYMTVPGNHEVTCAQLNDSICTGKNKLIPNKYVNITSQYRNFNAYMHRFYMPGGDGKSNGSYRNLWYSFDYGPVHMVVINTETDFPDAPSGPNTTLNGSNFAPDGTQVAWLKNDLTIANNNRKSVPWIIVAGHRPFFGSIPFESISNNCPQCNATFSTIIFEHKVDFYFCGHVHWFERLFPVDKSGQPQKHAHSYINQTGPIYVTTGAGGAPEKKQHMEIGGKAKASAYYNSTYGYSQLRIQSDTNCELVFFDSNLQNIIDRVEIIRRRT